MLKRKKSSGKLLKLPIWSFTFRAWRGGRRSCPAWTTLNIRASCTRAKRSSIREKLWAIRYTIKLIIIVMILLMKVEKKNTIASKASSFKNVKNTAHIISPVISMPWNNKTAKYKIACNPTIKAIVPENPKNLPNMKSCLLIGLESIRNIVFPSISLKSSWLPTKSTPISPNISIIPSPKSTITFSDSQMVSFPRAKENKINTKAKNRMRYKNLFLTISLKVFLAIFNIVWCFWKYSLFAILGSFTKNSSFHKSNYIWLYRRIT